jgi:hypothetical protein
MVRRHLFEVEQVEALIRSGDSLLLAGDERALARLPTGRWIAGTIPYFMTELGGLVDRRRVFVEMLPPGFEYVGVRRYDEHDISRVNVEIPAGGMGVIIVPNASRAHLAFALNAPRYDLFATAPLFGWVSGVHLSDVGSATPKVFDGTTGEALDQHAVVMHVGIPPRKVAELGILNIFEKGDGPAITFPSSGFSAAIADVDGERRDFAHYLGDAALDTRLPLVADYCGASVNVSFRSVDPRAPAVRFYAPVFPDVVYHHAKPVGDYVEAFVSALPSGLGDRLAFSCNCIVNYVHSALEGRRTGDIVGPMTFGEIAYQLLNQTLVYLTVSDAP